MQERRLKVLWAPTSGFLAHQTSRGISLRLRAKSGNLLVGENSGGPEAGKANLGDSPVEIMAVWFQEDWFGCVSVPGNLHGGGGICSYNKMSFISHGP